MWRARSGGEKKGGRRSVIRGCGGFSGKAKADHERGPEDWLFKNI